MNRLGHVMSGGVCTVRVLLMLCPLLCGLCCVDFAVWCRKNARITVALCVRADTQLWGSERWSCNVFVRRIRFERMKWTRKWMSRLWLLTVFSRPLRWQRYVCLPSFLGNHMVCLRCYACMWSLHSQVETAVVITRNAMGTRRRTQYHPCLQIPWDLVIIAQAHTVSSCENEACWLCFFYSCGFVEHVSVRCKRLPSEWNKVNRVASRAWFQDARGVGPIKYFCSSKPPNTYYVSTWERGFQSCLPVVLNGRVPGRWRWRVQKADLAKFYVFLFFIV